MSSPVLWVQELSECFASMTAVHDVTADLPAEQTCRRAANSKDERPRPVGE